MRKLEDLTSLIIYKLTNQHVLMAFHNVFQKLVEAEIAPALMLLLARFINRQDLVLYE